MKSFFLIGLILLSFSSQVKAAVSVVTDILKVQSEALSQAADKNANLLAESLEAQIANLYELDDVPQFDESDNMMLVRTVDSIYTHPIFKSRSGLTSALDGIGQFSNDINRINKLYSNATSLYKSAAGLKKLSTQG